jgi:hypothetical protein
VTAANAQVVRDRLVTGQCAEGPAKQPGVGLVAVVGAFNAEPAESWLQGCQLSQIWPAVARLQPAAVTSAVLLFRLLTFWLCVPFGCDALKYLERAQAL